VREIIAFFAGILLSHLLDIVKHEYFRHRDRAAQLKQTKELDDWLQASEDAKKKTVAGITVVKANRWRAGK